MGGARETWLQRVWLGRDFGRIGTSVSFRVYRTVENTLICILK
jgi:hypothetical protein